MKLPQQDFKLLNKKILNVIPSQVPKNIEKEEIILEPNKVKRKLLVPKIIKMTHIWVEEYLMRLK